MNNETVNNSLQFSFTFYHHVRYVGLCSYVNNTEIYGNPMVLPEPWHQIPIACASFLGFLLNALSLVVFICSNSVENAKSNTPGVTNLTKSTNEIPNKNHNLKKKVKISINQRNITTRIKKNKRWGSSFMPSLFLLCVCEVCFNLFVCLFKLLQIFYPYFIRQAPLDPDNHEPPNNLLLIMPIIQNTIGYALDVSVACRNWCVCMITAARAEVVIWPMGSKTCQRILRKPKTFFLCFFINVLIAVILYYIKHADYIGFLCYDEIQQKYAMWSKEYIWTNKKTQAYIAIIILPYQAGLVWFLIFLFTILITIHLKPWKIKKSLYDSNCHNSSIDDLPSIRDSVQIDIMRKRQKCQIRATKIVLVIAILFGVLECTSLFISIAYEMELLGENPLTRSIETVSNFMVCFDSICNFFIFFTMIPNFSQSLYKCCTCRSQ